MSLEHLHLHNPESITSNSTKIEAVVETGIEAAEVFDLESFFAPATDTDPSTQTAQLPELLVTLRNEADESIATFTHNVSSESFSVGATLTASVLSTLGNLIGSCGVLCAHSIGSLGQLGGSLSGLPGRSNNSSPSLYRDHLGNVHLDGQLQTLSKLTGIPSSDLLSGQFTTEDLLAAISTLFGHNLGLFFGFGMVETMMNCLFDSFLPTSSSAAIAA